MGAESTSATSAHRNAPIRRSHVEYATANVRANRQDVWCAWPLLLAFQLGTLVAGILSIRNLRDFSGWCLFRIAHCGGRSFQKPIVHIRQHPPLISAGQNGKQSSGVAFYSSSVQVVAQAGQSGRKCTGSGLPGIVRLAAAGADEPVPLAICDNGHRCYKREHF